FGFHAEQAVEKAAKAWLCLLGITIPRTHGLFSLFALVSQAGGSIEQRFESLATSPCSPSSFVTAFTTMTRSLSTAPH
ncbi:MAG: HEPN domain-containing protein, partial [Verrucomicrobiota bacterium]|nr:HEPN domain-containing protein [Verrucomicrobiota bacterium]